jgi:site-specific recombinase XerD
MNPISASIDSFLSAHDFSHHTARAIKSDLAKFFTWFELANGEAFDPARVTVRDVADFREHLSRVRRQAVGTVNRSLVTIRRFLGHLVQSGALTANPAAAVKELRRVPVVPKGLAPAEVRRIIREIAIRQDRRADAIVSLMLYCGLRVGDVAGLELPDLEIGARSGRAICRNGKGNKTRVVPLPPEARRALSQYLGSRPPGDAAAVFVGERGALTEDGVRSICSRYAALSGVKFSPHTLRHTFAHRFLDQGGDLAALAQLLGHENLNTTGVYTKRSQDDLSQMTENMRYE